MDHRVYKLVKRRCHETGFIGFLYTSINKFDYFRDTVRILGKRNGVCAL